MDPFSTYLEKKAPKQSAPVTPTGADDPFEAYLHPEKKVISRGVKEGTEIADVEKELTGLGIPITDELKSAYTSEMKLAKRRREYDEKGVGAVQSYKQFFQPFGDIVTLVPFGDRSVGNREYQKASQRFARGEATDDDIDAIATYEALQNARTNLEKSGVGGKIVSVAGDLGKIIPELMTGEAALAGGVKGYQAARAAKAAKDTGRVFTVGQGGQAVESAITPSLLSQGTRFAGKQAALTALSPSMFVPMAQQINMREGRDANDIRGYPTAYAYGVASNMAIGHMRSPDKGSFLATVAKKGGTAALEMSLIEDAARLMDEVIPKGYQIGSEGSNVSKVFRGIREGKDDAVREGLEHSLAQVVAFGLFGAMHREPGKGPERRNESGVKAWDEAVTKLKERGIKEADAGKHIERINDVIERELESNPYLDREGMKKLTEKITDPTLKEYAERIVESTVPDKSYGRMHDEVSKWLDDNRPQTSRNRVTPREAQRNQPYNLYTPIGPKPELAGGSPVRLPDPVAGAEAERLFKRLMSEGFDQAEASTIAQRVYEQSAANNSRAEKAAREAERAKEKDERKQTNPELTPDKVPAGGIKVDDLSTVSYADMQKAARVLGVPIKTEAGKLRPRSEIVRDMTDKGIGPAQVSDALNKAAEEAQAAKLATVASPKAGGAPAKSVPKAQVKVVSRKDLAEKPSETPTVPERTETAPASPPQGEKPDVGNRPAEPQITQPESTGATPERVGIGSAVEVAIDSNPSLSLRQKEEYKKAVAQVLASMPDAARSMLEKNIAGVKFYASGTEAAIASIRETLADPSLSAKERADYEQMLADRESGKVLAAGAFNFRTKNLHADGSAIAGPEAGRYPGAPAAGGEYPARAIWAHEAGHGLDANKQFSRDPEFKKAAIKEIATRTGTPLTEYAKKDFQESFAEFSRLLFGSDVPTHQIARDFPEVSAYFKSKGLWPAERGGVEKKLEEVFNDKIGNEKQHIDVRREDVATVAKPVEPAAPAKKVEKLSPPVAAVSEKRPNADRRYIESLREGKDAETIEAIDSVLHNMTGEEDTPRVSSRSGMVESTRRMNTLDNLAGAADTLVRAGKIGTPAYETLASIFRDLGGKQIGAKPGEVIKFDPGLYENDGPASSRERVEVVSQPMIGTDSTGAERTLVKGRTRPATVASIKAQRLRQLEETWATLRPGERKKVPEVAQEIRDLGGNPDDLGVKNKRGREEQSVLNPWVERELRNAADDGILTDQEHRIIEKRLRNLTLEQAGIGEGKAGGNYTRSRVSQIEKAAWEKLREGNPLVFGEHSSLEDFIAHERENLWRQPGELVIPRFSEIGDAVRAGAKYDSSVRKFLRRWLTAAGGLSDSAFAARIARDGRVQSKVQDVRNAEKDLGKALGGFDGVTPELARTLNDALTDTPDGLSARAKIRTTMANGQRIVDVLTRMRQEIDTLSKELIDSGVIEGDLKTVVEANMGMYLTRSYQVFNDAKWADKVPEDVKNRFVSWLRADLTKERGGKVPSELELQGIMESLLTNGTAADSPLAFIAQSKLGGRDLSILKARKDIPPELRALWGEVKDPLANYAATVARMTTLLENHKFLTRVRDEGLNRQFFKEEDLGKFKETFPDEKPYQIAPEGSKSMGPLAGLYTTKGLKDAFERSVSPEALPWYLQHYMKLLSATKYAKTIGSWVTHFRNFTSNTGFAVANGHFRAKNFSDSMRLLARDTDATRAEWKELIELGIVGDNIHASEFRDVVNDALGVNSPFFGTKLATVAENRATAWVKRGFDLTQKLYNAEDAVWKVFAFKNEQARYREAYPEWSDAQVKAKAAEIVRNTYPTYSMVSPAVRAARRFPLTGSFVSFPAEVLRTTYHTARQAFAEIQDPKTRQIGYTRLAGLITSGLMSAGLSAATAAMFGIDAEDDKDMRRFMPEWSKNSLFLHLGKDSQGRYKYVDLSRNDPHAYLTEAVIAALRAKSVDDAALAAANAVSRPFIEEEIGTRALLDVARNTKEEGGRVYNPQAPFMDKAGSIAGRLAEPMTPGSYSSARKMAMALAGGKEQKTGIEYDPMEEVVANFGLRVSPLDPARSLTFKAKSYAQAQTQAANMLTLMLRASGDVSDEELATVARKTDEARREVFDEFREDVIAAERLGMTKQEIRGQLKNAGMSQDEIGRVMNNNYQPFKPERQGNSEYRKRLSLLRN